MNKSRIISITLLVLFHIMIVGAFVIDAEARYGILAFYVLLFCIWAIEHRKTGKIDALLNGISARHRLDSRNVTILQTGYIRMRIDRHAAGSFSFKTLLQISVNVPPGYDAQGMKDTVETINEITKELHSEGLLVSCRMRVDSIDDDDTALQRVYPLFITVNEKITPERLGKLYDSLLEAIMNNGSNDCEHFTITGTESGTIYKHYRGNLCVGMIECEHGSRIFFNSSIDSPVYYGDDEKEFSEVQYKELRNSIAEDGLRLNLDEGAEYIRQILKKPGKGINTSIVKEDGHLSVTVSCRKSSVTYHLKRQDGIWWIYDYGNMMSVPVLSTESETEAVRMMVRLVNNVKSRLQK